MKKLNVQNVEKVLPFKIDMNYVRHFVSKKRYLILDLDETLIFCTRSQLHPDSIKLTDNQKGYITLWPFIFQFLEEVSKIFNLILFTASEAPYAEEVLKIIDPENKLFIIKLYW